MSTHREILVQLPGAGEVLGNARLRAAVEDLTVFEYTIQSGTEPGAPHYHRNHADSFFVLEGQLQFQIEGKKINAPTGSLIVAPRGAIHGFPIATTDRATFINPHTPGGFERYLRELTALRSTGETPTATFYEGHDIYFV